MIKKEKKKKLCLELCIYIALLLFVLFVVPKLLITRAVIDGSSMEPTLHNGESVLVEQISARIGRLDRFDIIVFRPDGRDGEEYYIKRIIGLPGETVQIRNGEIYIDGIKLYESYGITETMSYAGLAAEEILLGEDEYFVLGDNREVSEDSRYPRVGKVRREEISGKVLLRLWPLSGFGTVD